MSRIPDGFARVTRREPCPVCSRPDWCLRSADGSDRVLCARVESPIHWSCGWLHGTPSRRSGPRVVSIVDVPDFDAWERIARECVTRLHERSEIRGPLAEELGVSVESLDALGVGLYGRASTWPMRDHLGRPIGIRLRRLSDGSKYAMRGSRNGLFMPRSMNEQELVLLTEGATDTAAALTLGFFAIGRPDCAGGARLLVRWIMRRTNRDLVIIADNDGPGLKGARAQAEVLAAFARSVRVVTPPWGAKDLREALQSGADRSDLLGMIEACPMFDAETRWRAE